MRQKPVLYIIIPCYNEEAVLPVTAPLFLQKLQEMIQLSLIQEESRILFVNDGSRDRTWKIISELSKEDPHYMGIFAEPKSWPSKRSTGGVDGGKGYL